MSRIGKLPIIVPESVKVTIEGRKVTVIGPKGSLSLELPKIVDIKSEVGRLILTTKSDTKEGRMMHGTFRAHLANMVTGVSQGFKKVLEINGTGYRAEVRGNVLVLTLGYSHPVEIKAPEGVSFKVEKMDITVEGPSKEVVGKVSADIRAARPPEPYKGKGVKYKDEVLRRKAGKAAKAAGAA